MFAKERIDTPMTVTMLMVNKQQADETKAE